jgi:hypothetical protein
MICAYEQLGIWESSQLSFEDRRTKKLCVEMRECRTFRAQTQKRRDHLGFTDICNAALFTCQK